jgi:cell wall-associated NlpC family hydrolase
MLLSGLLSVLLSLQSGFGVPVLTRALTLVGSPYRFGGVTVERGFDCAAFVRYSYEAAGVHLPRTSESQWLAGWAVARDEMRPGDLVFFRNTYRHGISHVGLYLGDGQFVHAASAKREVAVDRLDGPYYAAHFAGARRVVP